MHLREDWKFIERNCWRWGQTASAVLYLSHGKAHVGREQERAEVLGFGTSYWAGGGRGGREEHGKPRKQFETHMVRHLMAGRYKTGVKQMQWKTATRGGVEAFQPKTRIAKKSVERLWGRRKKRVRKKYTAGTSGRESEETGGGRLRSKRKQTQPLVE